MPEGLPYMRLWVSDLLADLAELGLTDEEFGIYMRLLCVSWKQGGIPAAHQDRARLVSASPARLSKLWPIIECKWVSNGNGRLINPRQEREREEAQKKSAAGKAGAEARWGHKA